MNFERCFHRLRHLGILWVLLAVPLAAATSRIYVTNHAGTTISVIDPTTNKVVEEIKDIENPEAVSFSPDGSRVYITQAEKVLTVMDRKTGKQIKKVPISGRANDMMATKDGKLILVCIADDPGALDIIDAASLEKIKTIPTKRGMHDLDVTPDSKYAVSSSPEGKFITVFDLQSEQIAWQLDFDMGGPRPVAFENNPDGSARRIFVDLGTLRGFAVVDFAKRQEVARIKFPDDEPAAVASGGPSHGMGVAPDGKTAWFSSRTYNCVFVYSLPELKLLGRVHSPEMQVPGHAPVGGKPDWISFTPDSKTAYVVNAVDESVSAIDVKTLKAVARIPTGEVPGRSVTLVLP